MAFGYISRLLIDSGVGFIVEDGQAEEIEFHWTALAAGRLDQLRPGQRVRFETRPDHRDPARSRAFEIRLFSGP
jgi:cold shock CspA family protein